MTLEITLLDVLDRISRDIKEQCNILDGAYTRQVNDVAGKLVRVTSLACHEMNLLLTDASAGLALYTLYFHTQYRLSMTHRNTLYVPVCGARTDNFATFTLRTTQILLACLNIMQR